MTRRDSGASRTLVLLLVAIAVIATLAGCRKRQPPIARPTAPPPATSGTGSVPRPPSPPEPIAEPTPVMPADPMAEDDIASRTLEELNRDSPLQPVFFGYDSAEVGDDGRRILNTNAELLKRYATWVINVEGHADERGTAEYNLALAERRAQAARDYLVSLGISADRLRTVSYGKEFPFDPGHSESAWAKNRRAHFVIMSK